MLLLSPLGNIALKIVATQYSTAGGAAWEQDGHNNQGTQNNQWACLKGL